MQPFAGAWMNERQLVGVQQDTRCFVVRQFRQTPRLPLPISLVARERVADELKMNADLVGAARMKHGFHESGLA